MKKITNFILSEIEPSKDVGWLKPLEDGSYGMYIYTTKGWSYVGKTKESVTGVKVNEENVVDEEGIANIFIEKKDSGYIFMTASSFADGDSVSINGIKYNFDRPKVIPCTELSDYRLESIARSQTVDICNVTITKDVNIGYISSLKLCNVTYTANSIYKLFWDCAVSIKSFEIEGYLDASKVSNFNSAFSMFYNLETLDLRNCIVDNVETLNYCFSKNSRSLHEIDISTWNLSKVSSMTDIFTKSSAIATLKLGFYFGKMKDSVGTVDFSDLNRWENDSVKTLTTLYDRKSNGLGVITLKLSSNTKTALGEGGITTLTNIGYTIA